jgi:hypothetical protein
MKKQKILEVITSFFSTLVVYIFWLLFGLVENILKDHSINLINFFATRMYLDLFRIFGFVSSPINIYNSVFYLWYLLATSLSVLFIFFHYRKNKTKNIMLLIFTQMVLTIPSIIVTYLIMYLLLFLLMIFIS